MPEYFKGAEVVIKVQDDATSSPVAPARPSPVKPSGLDPDAVAKAIKGKEGPSQAAEIARGIAGQLPLGGNVSALAGAATPAAAMLAVVMAVKELSAKISERSEALAPYSGVLAAAQARAELSRTRADITSARENENAFGKFTEERAKLEASLSMLTDRVLGELSKMITPLIEAANWLLKHAGMGEEADVFGDEAGLREALSQLDVNPDIFRRRAGEVEAAKAAGDNARGVIAKTFVDIGFGPVGMGLRALGK